MKYLKSMLAFVFPLTMMLSSFSIYLLVNKLVDNYKDGVASDYSIIAIANQPIININELTNISFQKIEKINREAIINDVKDALSDGSMDLLNEQLPYFYQLYLTEFPTNNELQDIKNTLTELKSINAIEIFENEHTKLYSLLVLTKDIVTVLFVIVLVSSFLMLLQQIRIWFFEYSEKISILQLLGASLAYSTKGIVSIIIVSIIISLITVFGLMFLIMENFSLVSQPELLSILPNTQDMSLEAIKIVVLAILIPSIAFIALIIKHRINNNV